MLQIEHTQTTPPQASRSLLQISKHPHSLKYKLQAHLTDTGHTHICWFIRSERIDYGPQGNNIELVILTPCFSVLEYVPG